MDHAPAGNPTPGATFRDVFAVSEFRALWAAHVLSLVGDQFARVALSVLVFDRTGSVLLTASTYALSFLPWVIGGPLLSGLADRFPRRAVMIVTDLVRAGFVLLMVVPGVSLEVLLVLLFLTELCASPFSAARAAVLPQVLDGDRYVVGSAVNTISWELAQVIGFAVGGVVVALIGPRSALALDAVTFVLSAALLWKGMRERPAALGSATGGGALGDLAVGIRLVFGDPWLRTLTLLAWLCAFYMIPEALAVPLAAEEGGGAVAAGLLLAASPAGTVFGSMVLARAVAPVRRIRLMFPLAVLTGLPLVAFLFHPGLSGLGLLLFVSGVLSAYNLPANAAFIQAVPDSRRGQAVGLVQAGMAVGQGCGFLASGGLSEWLGPQIVVAVAGGASTVIAGGLALWVSVSGKAEKELSGSIGNYLR
jgi:predicted MFS family arabinose efflux permease